ncbi:MAG: FtsX-like permease family protein [Chitinophagaceae bacterium]|nr:FtsX-like permease family protein [Chitinophagaceae bacterium]
MFRNYFKLAVRHLSRNRLFSMINVVGLSSGIALTLLIAAYCWSEWRVNRQLTHPDRQYILTSRWKISGIGYPVANLGPLAKALKENYPRLVANYYRFDGITSTVSYGDKHFREGIQLGDSTLLTMYGFPVLYGDPRTALSQPFTVVIGADMAIKYFGKTDVVGQNLTIENFSGGKQDFRITGVLRDLTRNSVTWITEGNNNRIFIPASNLSFFGRNMDWPNISIVNYVELQKGVRPEALTGPIQRLVKANAAPGIAANLQVDVLPLSSYYFSGNGGTVEKMIYTLSSIALFILLMAMINFVNLSVRQSTSRMREIGIRKVLGSLRRQLIIQFLTESVLLAVMATVFALGLYIVFAPLVSGMLGKQIPSLSALPASAWILIPLFTLFTGGVAGLYPAFRLSSLASVDSLKGKASTTGDNTLLRKGLVGFQFATAMLVLVGAIIISQQISLFFSDRLGYDKEYVVAAQLPRDWSSKGVQHMLVLRSEFAKMPDVKDVTLSYEIPNGWNGGSRGMFKEGGDSSRAVVAEALITDEHYADTYRIPIQAGVYFHGAGGTSVQDSLRVVINETAVKALGWTTPQEAVGKRLHLFGNTPLYTISGVVKDFHFGGMGSAIAPELFLPVSRFITYRYFSFKLRPGNIGTTMTSLQKKWAALLPGAAFEYKFMDETLQFVYTDELRLRKAANSATVLALVIVLLGVIGLLASSIQRRTKEIAIRKVIGASVPGIIRLFFREYLPLLGIAGLAATPPAYLLMRHWLEGYATRVTITPWPFIAAMFGLGMVMVVLIVLQTMKAALANPVDSLKTE